MVPLNCSTDGRYACCLSIVRARPAWSRREMVINTASEIGTWDYKPEDVVAKGRVGPGEI